MARKGKNIYKRKDGRWEARYIASRGTGGKAKYKSVYGKTYGQADEKRTQALLSALTAQKLCEARKGLLETVTSDWLESRNGLKESTVAQYHSLITRHILPYWQGQMIGEINTFHVEQYVSCLLKSGLSPKTTADILILLRSIFKYAKKAGYSAVCDFKEIQIPKSNRSMRVLSQWEQRKLADFLLKNTDYSKLGVLLALYTGLRIGELCSLKWGHIDLKDRVLRVKQTMQRIKNLSGEGGTKTKIVITSPKSEKSMREIPIPEFLMPPLQKFAGEPNAYILTGSPDKFTEPRTMQKRFKAYLKASGVEDANFHATRHTFATRAVELGFDVKSLSELLGHANVNTTLMLYVHPSFALKREYMDRLGAG